MPLHFVICMLHSVLSCAVAFCIVYSAVLFYFVFYMLHSAVGCAVVF